MYSTTKVLKTYTIPLSAMNMEVTVYSDGDYSASLMAPDKKNGDSGDKVDNNILSLVPIGRFKRTQRNIPVKLLRNDAKEHHDVIVRNWKKITDICDQLLLDHSYMAPYYCGYMLNASTDVKLMRNWTVVCAGFHYAVMCKNIERTLCITHKDAWEGRHEHSCTVQSKKSPCYLLAKQSVEWVSAELLDIILCTNRLGPLTIDMKTIIGNEKHKLIDNVHCDSYYFLSHVKILKGLEHLKQCFGMTVGALKSCTLCKFYKHG